MNSATDWLANISVKWVLVAAGLLLVLRMSLPRMRTLPRQWADSTAEFVESALIAIVLVFLIIRPFVVQAFYIPSASMEDTLLVNDRILVNKFLFHFRNPRRGDIVVFHAPVEVAPDEKDYIKRVIGEPGDTVEVVPDTVMVGGKPAVQLLNRDPSGNFLKAEQRGVFVEKERAPQVQGNKLIVNDQPLVVVTPNGEAEYRDGQLWAEGQMMTYIGARDQVRTSNDLTPYGAAPDVEGVAYYDIHMDQPRLIVLKGNQLTVRPGHVKINGQPLKEPYIRESPRYAMPAYQVPPGRFFVMGDNRNDSNDSHAWGPLDEDRIIGKAMLIFWPLTRMRVLR